MKKIILVLSLLFYSFNLAFAWYIWQDETDEIYTKNKDEVIDDSNLDDSLRAGTRSAVENVEWVIDANTDTSEQSQENVVRYLSKWVNYFLWLLWLLLTILIIIQWIKIVTASWDTNKQKEALINVKNYILVLIWIAVSYLIVSLIVHFVSINSI